MAFGSAAVGFASDAASWEDSETVSQKLNSPGDGARGEPAGRGPQGTSCRAGAEPS